jgi:LuxR family maltose regulon positive regulatory protein
MQRTQPEQLPLLHRRASQWFEEQGLLENAINHSMTAQDLARAAALIEQVAPSLLSIEELSSLQRWLAALPSQMIQASPRLCIISAWLLYLTTQTDTFLLWLDAAEEALHAQEDSISQATTSTLRGEIVALRAAYTLRFNDFNRAIASCNEVLASLPSDNLYTRSLLLLILGLAYQRSVNVVAAAHALSEASNNSQAIGQSGHALVLPYVLVGQAELYESQGYPFQALKLCHETITLTKGRVGHPTGIAYVLLGYLFAEWQNVTAARQYLLKAWDIGVQANNSNVITNAAFFLIRLSVAEGHMNEGYYWLHQFETFIQNVGAFDSLSLVRSIRAWLALEQGNLEDALLWIQNYMPPPEEELTLRLDVEYFFQARVLIAASRAYADASYLQQAITLLEHMRRTAETIGRTKTVIDVLAMEVLVHYYQENLPAAFSALERALSLAEPGKYIRVFVSKGDPMAKLLRQLRDHYKTRKAEECTINLAYVRRLLAAFAQPAAHMQIIESTGELSLLEPLSGREREVLRLMADGRKNQEIASELVIVTGTVKAHIHSIYRKLAVNSRVQAIARARALNLL